MSENRQERSAPGAGEQAHAAAAGKPRMKECFGISFGWFMEDMIGDYGERLRCYECPDYDMCYKLTMVKNAVQLRFEIRRAAATVNRGFGGSHSAYPFG